MAKAILYIDDVIVKKQVSTCVSMNSLARSAAVFRHENAPSRQGIVEGKQERKNNSVKFVSRVCLFTE